MPSFTFDHIHLRSPDPEAAAAFYVEAFGASVVGRAAPGGPGRVVLALGGVTLFIEQPRAAAAGTPTVPSLGLEHIALAVVGFDAAIAELRAKGVPFAVEPHAPRPGIRIAFVQAPDGVQVEVLERSAG